MSMHLVVIYSKPDCGLCDEVKAWLEKLRQTHPFEFKEEIPVVSADGKRAFKYHLDEKEFLRRIGSEP